MRLNIFHNILLAPKFFLVIFLICASNFVHAYEGKCGTLQILQNQLNGVKPQRSAATLFNSTKCDYSQYYDSVYTIETQHIQVFYVLTGPHATTKAFADSTAAYMEEAWNFYVTKLGMRSPKGPKITHHYQKEVKDNLYPIEIIDIGQIRDPNLYQCNYCFGLTIQRENNTTTQIFMENDFLVGSANAQNQETIITNGDTCFYSKSYIHLRNSAHNFSYSDKWAKGIHLTSFHEFYHAVQLRYTNSISSENLFWLEASATGFEEVTNPDIDDYFSYIPYLFSDMGEPLSKQTSSNNNKIYAESTFFLYLYNKVSHEIDKLIWENISKNPEKPFEAQLEEALNKYNLNADSIFHDYSVYLSLSGNRANDIPKKNWINNDQSEWASANFYNESNIKPEVESLAFKFYHSPNNHTTPDISNFIGKASVIVYSKDYVTIYKIQNTKTIDSLASILSKSDSALWIFSRLGESENIPIVNKNSAPHAFPVPWKQGSLCFAPLPHDKKFIEIRTRRGDLISQEKYEGTSYCLQEEQVKSKLAPGIYRFRVGNKGKTQSFIVIY